jgi:hypothetical protein
MRSFVAIAVLATVVGVWTTSAAALTSPRVISVLDAPPGVDLPMGFDFDQPPVGGDQFAFEHTLYRWAGTKQGARVGHLHVVGTFVTGFGPRFSHPALMLFDAQAYLPGGSVMAEGYGRLNPDGPTRLTLAVIGGTGIYANARGQVKVRDLGNGNINKTSIIIRLLP